MAVEMATIMQVATLGAAIASGVIAVLILRKQTNENTEVSWRYIIASAVAFALAQAFTLAKAMSLPIPAGVLAHEPEAAYLVFALLFLLGIARQHQVVRNNPLD